MPQGSFHTPPAPIDVALIVDEGSNPFEMACACEIFGARRRPEIGFEPYRLTVVTPGADVAMRDGLFTLSGSSDLSTLDSAHTVIVPNRPDVDSPSRAEVLRALVRAHERGARLVGLCTGAYTLAEAGLLDGRSAAVHWQLATDFAARFPAVRVEPDVLYVDEGDVLTSAGLSAGAAAPTGAPTGAAAAGAPLVGAALVGWAAGSFWASTSFATFCADAHSLAVAPGFTSGRNPSGSLPLPDPGTWPSVVAIRMNEATFAASDFSTPRSRAAV